MPNLISKWPAVPIAWTKWNYNNSTKINGSVNGINVSIESDSSIAQGQLYGWPNGYPADSTKRLGLTTTTPLIVNDKPRKFTITFEKSVINPVLLFTSLGFVGSAGVNVKFSNQIEYAFRTGIAETSDRSFKGTEGYTMIRIPGNYITIYFDITFENPQEIGELHSFTLGLEPQMLPPSPRPASMPVISPAPNTPTPPSIIPLPAPSPPAQPPPKAGPIPARPIPVRGCGTKCCVDSDCQGDCCTCDPDQKICVPPMSCYRAVVQQQLTSKIDYELDKLRNELDETKRLLAELYVKPITLDWSLKRRGDGCLRFN